MANTIKDSPQSAGAYIHKLSGRLHKLEQSSASYIEVRTSDPQTDVIAPGYIWFRSDTNALKVWTGSTTKSVTLS